jgi:hypothetical protein
VTPAKDRFEALSQVYSAVGGGVECHVHRDELEQSSGLDILHCRFLVDVTRQGDCACLRREGDA